MRTKNFFSVLLTFALVTHVALGSGYFGGSGGGADDTSIARDGSRPPTADTPWGDHSITGLFGLGVGTGVPDANIRILAEESQGGNAIRITSRNTASNGSGEVVAQNDGPGKFIHSITGSALTVGDLGASNMGVFYGDSLPGGFLFTTPTVSTQIFALGGFDNANRRLVLESATTKIYNSDLSIETLGKGIKIVEGANAKMGVATLVAGTVSVATTAVSATSRIMLTCQDPNGGVPGAEYVSARVAATSFDITSTNVADTCIVAWMIVDPA